MSDDEIIRRLIMGAYERGWNDACATIRNVRIRYLDDGTEAVRPFRGLRLQAAGGASSPAETEA